MQNSFYTRFLFGFIICLVYSVSHATTLILSAKQTQFVNFLLPKVELVNQTIHMQRQELENLYQRHHVNQSLTSLEKTWLLDLAQKYKLKHFNLNKPQAWQNLLSRVDVIPVDLAIAQAANESGWGSSRFAKLGNNYFGQWCYKAGCGIVPQRRPVGERYEVRKFVSAQASVEHYIHNLNTNRAYKSLRRIRQRLRQDNQPITAVALAEGLVHYSQRGSAYVTSIKTLIRRVDVTVRTNA
ncbi:MAG: glucosaminidase domain-containing protein [Pseudomonadota bacterium]